MMIRRLAIPCLLCALLAPAQAQDIGVTAAVNQDAQAVLPGGGARTIELGDNVVFNQRIDTDAAGLVQILLADGTAFTVGPNSSMTIDSFVYDPAANTASVAASVTKGFVRFIGGRTSKSEGGVTIDTPIGTAGIRGAVANINVSGGDSIPPHISLVFGEEITLDPPSGGVQSITEAGYSIVVAGGQAQVQQTPPEFTAAMQQVLAPRPGTNGGSTATPSNQTVQRSGVADSNSGYGPGSNAMLTTAGYVGTVGNFDAAAAWTDIQNVYDELRDFFGSNPGYVDPDANPDAPTFMFAPVRVLTAQTYTDVDTNQIVAAGRGIVHVRPGDEGSLYYGFNGAEGLIQFEDGRVMSVPFLDDQPYTTSPVAGAYPGTLHVGQNEFRAYLLKDGNGSPVYAITGYAAAAGTIMQNQEIWRYKLSADPLAPISAPTGSVIPFADGLEVTNFNGGTSGDLLIASTPNATNGTIGRGLQAWVTMGAPGPGQQSAIGVTVGSVQILDAGGDRGPDYAGVHFTGERGGSRRTAQDGVFYSYGSVATVPSGEAQGGFFGANGENIVIGTTDAQDAGFGGESPGFGTIHVGNRTEVVTGTGAQRVDRTLTGFAGGVGTVAGTGTRAMRGVINLQLNAEQATVTGSVDANAADSGGETEWSFFNDPGSSAYIDPKIFAAQQNGTRAYLVSGAAMPTFDANGNDTTSICACEYLEWGWWGEAPGESVIGDTHMGAWIAADIADTVNSTLSGTATYNGNAVGTVINGSDQYIANGTMQANVDFGAGQGSVTINSFDNRNLFSSFDQSGNTFSSSASSLPNPGQIGMTVNGAFAGPNGEAIMGSFISSDGGWSASGIFGGAQ